MQKRFRYLPWADANYLQNYNSCKPKVKSGLTFENSQINCVNFYKCEQVLFVPNYRTCGFVNRGPDSKRVIPFSRGLPSMFMS